MGMKSDNGSHCCSFHLNVVDADKGVSELEAQTCVTISVTLVFSS